MPELVIDGSYGEGGGQILRTSLTLAAVSGHPIRLVNIRAGRPKPGLAAQHLSAVRAVAAVCAAQLEGDELGSQELCFRPQGSLRSGDYRFDVAEAREGGSAGATTLILQSLLVPLALADGDSSLALRGGTHVAWSPPFDYLRDVWLSALGEIGVAASAELRAWGWYPAGEGEIRLVVQPLGRAGLRPLTLVERGSLRRIRGRAVAANLPAHVAQRMAARAQALLGSLRVETQIETLRVRAACPGAGIFLTAEYDHVRCGFNALGERGKPSERVAEEAVASLLAHADSGAALDVHLSDQILAPLALASGPSRFSVERVSGHLKTNAWVIEQFGLARVAIEEARGGTGLVSLVPVVFP